MKIRVVYDGMNKARINRKQTVLTPAAYDLIDLLGGKIVVATARKEVAAGAECLFLKEVKTEDFGTFAYYENVDGAVDVCVDGLRRFFGRIPRRLYVEVSK